MPYVVLNNRQLSALVQAKPLSKAPLGRVDGIGDKKVERYGEAWLAMLAAAAAATTPAPVLTEVTA